MSFLAGVNGGSTGTGGTTPAGSSRFLGGIKQLDEKELKRQQLAREAETAKAEATRANSPATIAKETVLGIPKVLQSVGKALIDDPMKTLATPVIRAEQAAFTALGRATGNKNLERAANQPMTLPSIFGGDGGTIEPQRGWDDGGAKQIAGDALKYGATVYTGGAAAPVVGAARQGLIRTAATQGAKEGAIATGAYTGGDELQRRDSTVQSVATEAAKGVGLGGFLGGVLAGGGAAIARRGMPKDLPIAFEESIGQPNVRTIKNLPVQDENILPGRTRANARQVPITRQADPYLPESDLPVIQAGPKAKSSLPEIQFAAPKSRATGDITYEPVRTAPTTETARPAAPATPTPKVPKPIRGEVSAAAKRNTQPAPGTPARADITPRPTRPVTMDVPKRTASVEVNKPRPGQTTTVSKAASDANKKLVEQGIEAIPEEELARIGSINKADQIDRVARLMDDPRVKDMAAGTYPVPDGVAPQVLFNAVKNRAVKEGDFETLQRLARSKIAEERATAAQTLGSAGYNNEPADALAAMKDIEKTRSEAAARRRQPSDVKKEAKTAEAAIKRVQAKQTWDDIINGLTC